MKKIIIVVSSILIVLLLVTTVAVLQNQKKILDIKKENEVYESYLNKEVFGTDVLSLINKATNENVQNEIPKDEKGYFMQNDTNSIGIEIKMLNEGKYTTYKMETIQKVGVEGFIQNFNLISFKVIKIQYHDKTKKVSKVIFEQIEE